ncbi:PiggyBac transposable element-derived protein 4 [Anthophora quadrimaculata]
MKILLQAVQLTIYFKPSPSKRCRMLSDSEESSSSSLSDLMIPFSIRRRRIESDSESEFEDDGNNDENNNNTQEEVSDTNWHIPSCNQPKITFSNSSGINTHRSEIFDYTEPHSFYCLFVSNETFEIIANQINIYAAKIVSEQRSRRLDKWIETNPNEIKRSFGLIIWMGLVRLPKIHLYWSRNEEYHQAFPSTVMSRNRFKLLLRFIHFSNNEENEPSNRLSKIIHIIDILNRSFKEYYNPDEILCVDESLVPFRGRIIFRHNLKQKRHRYGIKIFKLCCGAGYTYSFQIYTGKEKNRDKTAGTVSSEIVMTLCKNILGKRHTVCTDNWYTSVDLAEQ